MSMQIFLAFTIPAVAVWAFMVAPRFFSHLLVGLLIGGLATWIVVGIAMNQPHEYHKAVREIEAPAIPAPSVRPAPSSPTYFVKD
jgi:hypothetical protein